MEKTLMILRESLRLAKKHKMYFLLPFLIMLAILALLAYQLGPGFVVAFIYAGI
ncbi:MAG: hypothetical protein NDI60_03960 [Elusimicrobiales bacterium]|nr:hypothetical protein [Elusimicrobiales bacterium]